jgi:serine/threonine protein kinase
VRFIAKGGMGRVDLALRHVDSFRRLYAVKRLHPHLADDPVARQMFLEEAQIGGLLTHPNVVGIIDYAEDADGPYLVMDYVEGVALSTLLSLARKKGQQLSIEACVSVLLAIARGLEAIHSASDATGEPMHLLHRDLSPKNVLVGYDGSVRVTDFGIAKSATSSIRTTTGVLKGTVGYVAPERLKFDDPAPRSDLFSLGVVAYEVTVGERLYQGDAAKVGRDTLTAPAPDIGELRPDAPASLTQLVFRLLAKEPEDRPESASEVVALLEDLLAEIAEAPSLALHVAMLANDRRDADRAATESSVKSLVAAPVDEETPDTRPDVAHPETARPRPWLRYAVATVLILAITAVAYVQLRAPPIEPMPEAASEPPADPEPRTPTEDEPEPDPTAEATAEARAAAPAEPASPTMATDEPAPVAVSPMRAPMRRGRMPMAPAMMSGSAGTPLEMTWGGEFE